MFYEFSSPPGRGPQRRFSPEVRERAARLVLEDGWTHARAAKVSGASVSSVYLWVRARREQLGWSPKPVRRHSEDQRAKAVRLVLDEGMTLAGAARSVDAATPTVHAWVRAARQSSRKPAVTASAYESRREEALRLVIENGMSKKAVARMLGARLGEVCEWVRQTREQGQA